jgi:hypothetical protein
MTGEDDSALDRAGTALLHAAKLQAQIANKPNKPKLKDAGYTALLVEARRALLAAGAAEDQHKLFAAQTALKILEAAERGEADLGGVRLFKGFVEGVHGGEREIDLGGRPRTGRKPSADQAFLRAAAVVLWERFPGKRDQLVSHARTLIGVGTEAKLQKIVENFNQRHDVDTAHSGSPLSIHMPLVKELIDRHGYRALKDFA